MPRRRERDTWEVSVSRNGENLVVIGSNHLSGKPEFSEQDAQVIRACAQQLLSFIGAEPEIRRGLPVVPETGGGEPPLLKAPALFDGARADLLRRIDALKHSRNNVHWITIAPLLLMDVESYLRQQVDGEAQPVSNTSPEDLPGEQA